MKKKIPEINTNKISTLGRLREKMNKKKTKNQYQKNLNIQNIKRKMNQKSIPKKPQKIQKIKRKIKENKNPKINTNKFSRYKRVREK
jgi:hypothetical protein